jgi:hypothetical protein
MYNMRRERLVVSGGFLVVAAGWIGETAVYRWGVPDAVGGEYQADLVFGLASVLGYVVIACASWAWFRWIEASPVSLGGLGKVLRFFAIGNLLLAVAVGGLGYFWVHWAISQPFDGRTTPVIAASNGLQSFGFLLAAIAFWGASSKVRSRRGAHSLREQDLVAV